MNDSGINMQVLSVAGAGADLLAAQPGVAFARQYNNMIAERSPLTRVGLLHLHICL
jgi:hypothetical protein